mgnify:CR=1 FL=1
MLWCEPDDGGRAPACWYGSYGPAVGAWYSEIQYSISIPIEIAEALNRAHEVRSEECCGANPKKADVRCRLAAGKGRTGPALEAEPHMLGTNTASATKL